MGGGGAAGGIPYPFPQPTSAIRCAQPYAILQPLVRQRGCAWGGHPGSDCQGCGGACSASLSRLLQPSVCGVENLGIVASGHRSLDPQSLHGHVTFPDGDHPVCPAVCPSGGLDGLHRSQGGLPTGSYPSGISPVPPFCGTWPYLSVHSTVLWRFSRVMAPVSAILHSWGIRMRRYLDDWLVQSSSREALLRDLQVVLSLCRELGIVINPEKYNFEPSQVVQYLGVVIDAQTFVASPSPECIARLLSTAGEFLSSADPPASIWLSLLGMLSSMSHLVPGSRLRMRSLHLCLHQSWDRVDQSTRIPWSLDCLQVLGWWLQLPAFLRGCLSVKCLLT